MIELEYVIKKYKITNLKAKTICKTNGCEVNYSKSNLRWVTSQIDYFNSKFTDTKARDDFTLIIQSWYYNFLFKKYKPLFKGRDDFTDRIYTASIDMTLRFLEMYNRRIRAVCKMAKIKCPDLKVVKYDKGMLSIRDATDKDIKRKAKECKTEKEQFDLVFQSYIGSLRQYTLAYDSPFAEYDEENIEFISYGATLTDEFLYELTDGYDKYYKII